MSSLAAAGPSMTVREAANLFNVSPATIYTLIRKGKITAYRLGSRTIRLDPEELVAAVRA